MYKLHVFLVLVFFYSCSSAQTSGNDKQDKSNGPVITTGAMQTEVYLPFLKGKRIGIVANQTTTIGNTHLVDSLLSLGVEVVRVFGPEHGFRGYAAAGEHVEDGTDPKTGLKVISLYGSHRKPKPEDLQGIELMIFDIQDVGARFYTYISTMSYVMEACAEADIPMLIFDRPNPHGDYVDGPVLDPDFSSFVGLHTIPVVHGMTIAEYARMVNGERWLKDSIQCELQVITMKNYSHLSTYVLPVPPSPNLPNQNAILLYPSLCFFEGTIMSVGRGTDFPFQVVGHPEYGLGSFAFMPEDRPGVAMNPKYKGVVCYGQSLAGFVEHIQDNPKRLYLGGMIDMYNYFKGKEDFFIPFFDKLAGTDELRLQIEGGMQEKEIRQSWKEGIDKYKLMRKNYLLYQDFE